MWEGVKPISIRGVKMGGITGEEGDRCPRRLWRSTGLAPATPVMVALAISLQQQVPVTYFINKKSSSIIMIILL